MARKNTEGSLDQCRSSLRAQTLAFLSVEAVYIALHVKPLVPLVSGQQLDTAFLRTFTVAGYFASELALFWLLAYASPIRCVAAMVSRF